jgi:hypothetical protein
MRKSIYTVPIVSRDLVQLHNYWDSKKLMPRGPKGEKRPADVIGNGSVHTR